MIDIEDILGVVVVVIAITGTVAAVLGCILLAYGVGAAVLGGAI